MKKLDPKKNYVVVGLGASGFSCVQYLKRQGCQVAVTDSRADPPKKDLLQTHYPDVQLETGGFSEDLLKSAHEIVVSPGVSLREPIIAERQAAGVPVYGDIELFARLAKAPIVAITGSNGKTTVTTLVGLMAKAANREVIVCGNIGNPVLDELERPVPEFYILELSSFQLETTHNLSASVAVVLNVSEDHMDRYSSLADYMGAKQTIYRGCEKAVLNANEPAIWQNLAFSQSAIFFDIEKEINNGFCLQMKQGEYYLSHNGRLLMPVSKLKLQFRHHLQNTLAALALGEAMGLPQNVMLKTLEKFTGLIHRCEWVREHRKVNWFNDSKATNVGAANAAIISLGKTKKNQLILLAGGDGKNADFSPLRESISKYVDHTILFGQDAKKIEKALLGVSQIHHVDDMEEAVYLADQLATEQDMVLLSPACASFDMFNNYEHRGEVYMQLVRSL